MKLNIFHELMRYLRGSYLSRTNEVFERKLISQLKELIEKVSSNMCRLHLELSTTVLIKRTENIIQSEQFQNVD
jgi:hypothetical protein